MAPRTPEQNEEIRRKTRRQIVDAAFELFAKDGYEATSIAAIAKNADVSKGLIYHYFESKQNILEAILDQMVEVGDQILDFPDNFTAVDKIRQTVEGTFQFIEQEPEKGRLMISLALQPDAFSNLKTQIDEVNENQLALYIDILGDLGYEQPELEAYRLGAMMDGFLLGYITMGEEYPLQEMKQKILDEYVHHKKNN
ncbi:TetR/AcrR family transcriptional regulator [Aliifodinibius sp. S!AR15-10]|uniref:TetR/AcrR family transcriptional regulator n=1 Tax=Aliifodinibius sp. S!AR15-10 TaxID=2950437 RepID=UPI00285F4B07|nr:TetR/AcrR family transcriptional regulator [Aliifodinibius sp. S!AR15-10]MDR8394469.1 TetR/AcrR family transcriptional regulator [Aliifodinibius sp. S!AR15-10]